MMSSDVPSRDGVDGLSVQQKKAVESAVKTVWGRHGGVADGFRPVQCTNGAKTLSDCLGTIVSEHEGVDKPTHGRQRSRARAVIHEMLQVCSLLANNPNTPGNVVARVSVLLDTLGRAIGLLTAPVVGACLVECSNAIARESTARPSPFSRPVCRGLASVIVNNSKSANASDLRLVLRVLLKALAGAPVSLESVIDSAIEVLCSDDPGSRILHNVAVAAEVVQAWAGAKEAGCGGSVSEYLDSRFARLVSALSASFRCALGCSHVCRALTIVNEGEGSDMWAQLLFPSSAAMELQSPVLDCEWRGNVLRDALSQCQLSQFDWICGIIDRAADPQFDPLRETPTTATLRPALRGIVLSTLVERASDVAARVGDLTANEVPGGPGDSSWAHRFREWNAFSDLAHVLVGKRSVDFEPFFLELVAKISKQCGGQSLALWSLLRCIDHPHVVDALIAAVRSPTTKNGSAGWAPPSALHAALVKTLVGGLVTPLPPATSPGWFFSMSIFCDLLRPGKDVLELVSQWHPPLVRIFTEYQEQYRSCKSVVDLLEKSDSASTPLGLREWHMVGAISRISSTNINAIIIMRLAAGIHSLSNPTSAENGRVVAYLPSPSASGALAVGVDPQWIDQMSGRCRARLAVQYYQEFVKLCKGEGGISAVAAPFVETFARLCRMVPSPFLDFLPSLWAHGAHRLVPALQEALSPVALERSPIPAHILVELLAHRLVLQVRTSPGLPQIVALLADGARRATNKTLSQELLACAMKLSASSFSGVLAAYKGPAAEALIGTLSNEMLVRAVLRSLAVSLRTTGHHGTPLFGLRDIEALLLRIDAAWGWRMRWSDAAIARFPEPLKSFYTSRAARYKAEFETGKIALSDIQQVKNITALFLVGEGPALDIFASQFTVPERQRLLLPSLYVAGRQIVGDRSTQLNIGGVRKALQAIGPGALLALIPSFVDFVVDMVQRDEFDTFPPKRDLLPHAHVLDDLCFRYSIIPLELVMNALLRGVYDGQSLTIASNLIRVLLNPDKPHDAEPSVRTSRRCAEFMNLGLPSELHSTTVKDPPASSHPSVPGSLFKLQAQRAQLASGGVDQRGGDHIRHQPLPVYFGDYALRLLSVLDTFIVQCFEHPVENKNVVAMADLYGTLYRYHDFPVHFVHETLAYYSTRESPPSMGASAARAGLVGLLVHDAVPQTSTMKERNAGAVGLSRTGAHSLFSPEFLAFVISMKSPPSNGANSSPLFEFASQPVYLAAFVLRLVLRLGDPFAGESEECVDGDTRPRVNVDWRFSEFSCPRSRLLIIAATEILALPVNICSTCEALVSIALDGIPSDAIGAALALVQEQRDRKAPGLFATLRLPLHRLRHIRHSDVVHAVGALLSRLPADVVGPIISAKLCEAVVIAGSDGSTDWLHSMCGCGLESSANSETSSLALHPSVTESTTSRFIALAHIYGVYGGFGAIGVLSSALADAVQFVMSYKQASYACHTLVPFISSIRRRQPFIWEESVHSLANALAKVGRNASCHVAETKSGKRSWETAFAPVCDSSEHTALESVLCFAFELLDGATLSPAIHSKMSDALGALEPSTREKFGLIAFDTKVV